MNRKQCSWMSSICLERRLLQNSRKSYCEPAQFTALVSLVEENREDIKIYGAVVLMKDSYNSGQHKYRIIGIVRLMNFFDAARYLPLEKKKATYCQRRSQYIELESDVLMKDGSIILKWLEQVCANRQTKLHLEFPVKNSSKSGQSGSTSLNFTKLCLYDLRNYCAY